MEGREKAEEFQLQLAMFTAWQTARLSSFTEKLPQLHREMAKLGPKQPARPQSRQELLAALRAIKATVH